MLRPRRRGLFAERGTMNKGLIAAAVALGLAGLAHADENGAIGGAGAAPAAANAASNAAATAVGSAASNADGPVDALTWRGFTLYGTLDAGYNVETHGVRASPQFPPGPEYLISKNSNQPQYQWAPNGLSQSQIGLKGDFPVGGDTNVLFKADTGFNPLTGRLSDALGAQQANNGVPASAQTANADSSRAGQVINGQGYAGVGNATWGTLTYGRHNSLILDGMSRYDPQALSYAFSLIGYSGVYAGAGSSEDARLDNSFKYSNQLGPVRLAGLYQLGGTTGSPGTAYSLNAGTEYGAYAVDAYYAVKHDAIASTALSPTQVLTAPSGALSGAVSDNSAYALMMSYLWGPAKFYLGFEGITFTNPANPLQAGQETIGGYTLGVVNNTAYNLHKELFVTWAGVKYAFTPNLDLTGAYYHLSQNSYNANGCGNNSAASCSGEGDIASLVLDYKLIRRVDVYAGGMYSVFSNGLASGYLYTHNVSWMTGARFSF